MLHPRLGLHFKHVRPRTASWPHDLDDEAILARLLALNLERVAQQGGDGTGYALR